MLMCYFDVLKLTAISCRCCYKTMLMST